MRRLVSGLLGLLGALVGGCTIVPPPVLAPRSRPPSPVAITWAAAWGAGHAHARRPDGTIATLSGNTALGWGQENATAPILEGVLLPAMLSLQTGEGSWDASAYLSWRRAGVTGRRRLATTPGGAATSVVSSLNAHWTLKGVDGSVALEQSLPANHWATPLFRLGVSAGLRDADIQVPDDLDRTAGRDNTVGVAHFDILRTEVRVESVFGLSVGEGRFVLSVQPYFVVARGHIWDVSCALCVAGVELLDFTHDRGFAVAFTMQGS